MNESLDIYFIFGVVFIMALVFAAIGSVLYHYISEERNK